MDSDEILDIALLGYAASLKAGEASLYESLRFFQNSFRYHGEDLEALVRQAALALVCHDPLFLMTDPHGIFLDGFSEEDVCKCVESWSLDDECLAAMCEGHLRMATVSYHEPDLDRVEKALEVLEKAKQRFGKGKKFQTVYAEALRVLGDERSQGVFDELLENTDPEWRSHGLRRAMEHAVEKGDWGRYDSLRERWGEMPKNAHVCECAINFVANIDGLRCLERGENERAISLLEEAVLVAGCPHLNTGSGLVDLAHELLDRKLAKKEVEEHLVALEGYCESEETAELRERLFPTFLE